MTLTKKNNIIKHTEDIVDFKEIYEDGVFKINNKLYSKTWLLTDINYEIAPEETLKEYAESWSNFIKTLDYRMTWKLHIHKFSVSRSKLENELLLKPQNNLIEDYNDIVKSLAIKTNNLRTAIYLTATTYAEDYAEARRFLDAAEGDLIKNLSEICNNAGCKCIPVSAEKRLNLLFSFYRHNSPYSNEFVLNENRKIDTDKAKRYLSPGSIEFSKPDRIVLDNTVVKTLYAKTFDTYLDVATFKSICSTDCTMIITLDLNPQDRGKSERYVNERYMISTANIQKRIRKAEEQNRSAFIPEDIKKENEAVLEVYNDVRDRDQIIIYGMLSVSVFAENDSDCDEYCRQMQTVKGIDFVTLPRKQIDLFLNSLPLGHNKAPFFRPFTSGSMAAFAPFRMQEMYDSNGFFIGINQITKNALKLDINKVMNSNMFISGVPGSGKSMFAKLLTCAVIAATDYDIVVCDPMGEYTPFLVPFNATIVNISAGGKNHINLFDRNGEFTLEELVLRKINIIKSIIETTNGCPVTGKELSVIDRNIKLCYDRYPTPTLVEFYNLLKNSEDSTALSLADSLELYAVGSLNTFACPTNVDVNARIVAYDLSTMTGAMKPIGQTIVTDHMLGRVTQNQLAKKRTFIIVDEIQRMLKDGMLAEWFEQAWREFRKQGGIPVGLAQNIASVVKNEISATMFSNSEISIMMNQGSLDQDVISELYGIEEELLKYVNNADIGTGLIRYGAAVIPFSCKIPQEVQSTTLFKVMNTKPVG